MKKVVVVVCLLASLVVSAARKTNGTDTTAWLREKFSANDADIRKFYNVIQQTRFAHVHEILSKEREMLVLDDWFYYKLIRAYTDEKFIQQDNNFKALICWYVLNKSGYDVRIEKFRNKEILLYAYSVDKVLNVQQYTKNFKNYICLNSSALLAGGVNEAMVFIPKQKVKPFSFVIHHMPSVPSSYQGDTHERGYNSDILQKFLVFKIQQNPATLAWLEDYPCLEMGKLFNTPLSVEAYQSVIPPLKTYLEGKDLVYQASFLLEFVRNAFIYMADQDTLSFSREKWLVPDEVLYYPYADCEDLALMFYCLSKELLHVPMIILHYPGKQHINIGISLPGLSGGVAYKGRMYAVCEFTNKIESLGQKTVAEQWKYEVIGRYDPEEVQESPD